jgi:hypothetical protein
MPLRIVTLCAAPKTLIKPASTLIWPYGIDFIEIEMLADGRTANELRARNGSAFVIQSQSLRLLQLFLPRGKAMILYCQVIEGGILTEKQ